VIFSESSSGVAKRKLLKLRRGTGKGGRRLYRFWTVLSLQEKERDWILKIADE
jgi:hypothetical protein